MPSYQTGNASLRGTVRVARGRTTHRTHDSKRLKAYLYGLLLIRWQVYLLDTIEQEKKCGSTFLLFIVNDKFYRNNIFTRFTDG